jgi:hypothetical protein
MNDTLLIGAHQNQLFATLLPEERMVAESLLQAAPNYRYNLKGFPPLDTSPAPGPEIGSSSGEGDDGVDQVASVGLTVAA